MKLVDDLLKKIGTDKVLHHILGGLICSLFTIVFLLQEKETGWLATAYPTIGAIVVLIVSVIKEFLDTKFDWLDILWAMAGCLWVYLAVVFGVLFGIASY